jgi:hypothetical protein
MARPAVNGVQRQQRHTSAQLAAIRHDLDPAVIKCYEETGIDLSDMPALCDSGELALRIGTTAGALAQDRYLHRGIPYIKLGRRVRYSRIVVAQYLMDHFHRSKT